MPHNARVGIQISQADPFWVQVCEVVWRQAQATQVELIEIAIDRPELLTRHEQRKVAERLAAQGLDALLCNIYPHDLLRRLLEHGISVVSVDESPIRHPLFTAREGLFEAAATLGAFMHERLGGGVVLIVGGHMSAGDNGQSRIDGFLSALPPGERYRVFHLPSRWLADDARARVGAWLRDHADLRVDAVFGINDTLALAAREALDAHRADARDTLVLGFNGDPLALAALATGAMTATVETDVEDIAAQAVALACRAAQGERPPQRFANRERLVTAANVGEVAARKLISLAALPTRLVGTGWRAGPQRVVLIEPGLTVEHHLAPPPTHAGALVSRAAAFIQQRYGAPLTRQEIADSVGVSKDYLGRIFHEEMGTSLWEYLLRFRVLRAKELLRTTDFSVAEVATRVGIQDAAYFSRLFHQRTGCAPRDFRTQ
jgi:ABC-type sugar transport system substrate-binding protein/AraC-like DNA-binding protein